MEIGPAKPRLRRRARKLIVGAILVIAGILANQYGWLEQPNQVLKQTQPGLYIVAKFDDGDTIRVNMNGKVETIRMIGVDTPETHDPRKAVQCFGFAAADFTRTIIGTSSVRLESDPLSSNRDRYNRLLRYVYLPDGRLVNLEIITQGYGFAYTSFPFTKSDVFAAAQKSARDNKRGLWSKCAPSQNKYGGFTSNDSE